MDERVREYLSSLDAALNTLDKKDDYLLNAGASERAICYRLASHIQDSFQTYNVDCEYNLNIDNVRDRKEIWAVEEELRATRKQIERRHRRSIEQTPYYAISVYPDIIVHRRGTNDENLLIIEVKKSDSLEDLDYDRFKLRHYTATDVNEFKYRLGILLVLNVGPTLARKHKKTCFLDGAELAEGAITRL